MKIAVRAYPEGEDRDPRLLKSWRRPGAMLVFDTETRTDATQRLTFGSYRFIVAGRCLEEGLFYADDLSKRDRRVLEGYVATHSADTVAEGVQQLGLLTRGQFVEKVYRAAYKGRCLLVAFNFPFDVSRIARKFTTARGRFAGGFSLGLWSYVDKSGRERTNQYRPRIGVKQIDSKRALKGFTARNSPDKSDLIPEGSFSGRPKRGYVFRGHFLDLRTLAFALTDKGHTLESACKAFEVEHGKQSSASHGTVTEAYIDYNRRDVLATSELAAKLLEEYAKHPISLQVTKAYSPASIGKAYLREMGIEPILRRQPDFPKAYLGYAQSAFYGGRTSAHIRKVAVPVVSVDFLSMYPTVNSLMGLWSFVIARKIRVVRHCKAEIRAFLSALRTDDLFKPATWKQMTAFVRVVPDGDILPSRARYTSASNDWQVAVNHLHAGSTNPKDALWFSLPDIIASVLLTGCIPKIVDAFRIVPSGTLQGLKSIKLRGEIAVDPKTQDFFKVTIEERQRLASRTDLSPPVKDRLDKALKILANATSYGIYAEMIRRESDRKVEVTCHGIDAKPFQCCVAHADDPGEYCFPPLASLITGAARLMLALLEHSVRELGGTYAMEDTDSMAIVATERGRMVPWPGGRTKDGLEAVKALPWEDLRQLSQRFTTLNPCDRGAVPGSILKIEDDNFESSTSKRRQLHCVAISAKRYALFLRDRNGSPVLLREGKNNKDNRWSEHGLGHLLNPTDAESEDRDWISQIWLNIVSKTLRFPTRVLRFERLPAIGRTTISSPAVLRPLAQLNEGKKYPDQIKPFNFLMACHVSPLGHPDGVNPERFHLMAPYESDSRKWLKADWVDQYTGKRYGITTVGHYGSRNTARVKTYGDVALEYEFHPEAKCADADGNPSSKQSVGLLQRRHVRVDQIKFIGKESNSLEEVESGLIHSAENVYTEYRDPRRDEWATKILPALKKAPLKLLVKKCRGQLSRRAIIDLRAGRSSRPHRKTRDLLVAILKNLGQSS